MPKRYRSDASGEETQRAMPAKKRQRGNSVHNPEPTPSPSPSPTAAPRRRPKRSASEALEDSQHATKKARADSTPNNRENDIGRPIQRATAARRPTSPMRSAERARWLSWRQQFRQAIRYSNNLRRQKQDEYIRFRQGQHHLPSPVWFDIGLDPDFSHPDADEFGFVPYMFGLDDDDPRVAEVFGKDYARRLRRRIAQRSQPKPDARGGSGLVETRAQVAPRSARADIPTAQRNQSAQGILFSTGRLTRQAPPRNKVFYELDPKGRARIL